MMKKIIILIMCLFPAIIFAQSASDYFHAAANHYVNANKKNAETIIREAIQKFPDDQKLKDLASKVEELPDPESEQNQQNQDKQDQQDQQDDQQSQDQKNEEQQQISPEDAQRLLDALSQDEKELLEKLQQKERAGQRPNIERNW